MNRRLKMLLVEKGVRNFDLAKHLDCDPAKVSKIVNGWLDPDRETRQKIAEFLGANEAEIWQ
jgi:ribosome-binding protein aMBF1 (putative translation factor)